MEDEKIVELFLSRAEKAIIETERKYDKYLKTISYNILQDEEDAKECVNDTYLKTWNSIPPNNPKFLKLYLAKITRNIALNKYKSKNIKKRGSTIEIVIEELQECSNIDQKIQYDTLLQNINEFLTKLSKEKRKIFLERYWYFETIKEISKKNKISESNVKIILLRTREKLKEYLKEVENI